MLPPHYVQCIHIDTFVSEARLYIFGFDSHDFHSKFIIKVENVQKNCETLDDAPFEQDDEITIIKH